MNKCAEIFSDPMGGRSDTHDDESINNQSATIMPGESSRQKHRDGIGERLAGWPMATAANSVCNFTYRWHIAGGGHGAVYGVLQWFSSYKKYADIVLRGTIRGNLRERQIHHRIVYRILTCDVVTNIKGTVGRFHGAVPSTNVIRHVCDVD